MIQFFFKLINFFIFDIFDTTFINYLIRDIIDVENNNFIHVDIFDKGFIL